MNFILFLLVLISDFMSLCSEYFVWLVFLNDKTYMIWFMTYPGYVPYFTRMYIPLLCERISCICLLSSFDLKYSSSPTFPIDFLSRCPIHCLQWDIEVPYYYCIVVYFSFQICWYISIFRCSNVGYICIFTTVMSSWWFNPFIIT